MLHAARPRGTHHHPCSHQHNSLCCCTQEGVYQITQFHNEEQYQGPRANFSPPDNLFHSPTTLRGPFSFLKMLLCQALRCVQQCQLHPSWHVAVASVPQTGPYATGTKYTKDTFFQFTVPKPVVFVSSSFQNAERSHLSNAKPRNWEAHNLFGFLTKLLEHLTGITSCLLPSELSQKK